MLKVENKQEKLVTISKILLSQINIKSVKHMGRSRDVECILNRGFISSDQTIVNIFVKVLAKNECFNILETIISFKNKTKMTTLVLKSDQLHLIYDNLVGSLFVSEKLKRKSVTLKMSENETNHRSEDHIILEELINKIKVDQNLMHQGLIKEYPYLDQSNEKDNVEPRVLVKC